MKPNGVRLGNINRSRASPTTERFKPLRLQMGYCRALIGVMAPCSPRPMRARRPSGNARTISSPKPSSMQHTGTTAFLASANVSSLTCRRASAFWHTLSHRTMRSNTGAKLAHMPGMFKVVLAASAASAANQEAPSLHDQPRIPPIRNDYSPAARRRLRGVATGASGTSSSGFASAASNASRNNVSRRSFSTFSPNTSFT